MMDDLRNERATTAAGVGVPWILVIVFAPLLVPLLVALAPPVVEQVLLGWLYFPFRVLPQVTVEWPSVALGAVSMGLFVAGLHRTLPWFLRASGRDEVPHRTWSLRSTIIVAAGLWVLFGAGTAMVAATHQAVWLASGRGGDAAPRVGGLLARFRDHARRTQFSNSQHQIGLAFLNAHDVSQRLPAGGTMTEGGRLLHGWAIHIAPYNMLSYDGIDFSVPWHEPPNDRLYQCAVPLFLNPAVPEVFDADGYGLSHVAGNVHVLPIDTMENASATHSPEAGRQPTGAAGPATRGRYGLSEITDGAAQTMLIGEVATRFKPWAHPANVRDPSLGINRSPDGFGSRTGRGSALCTMCDGSLRELSEEIDPDVLRALATPAGNDAVPVDF